MDERAKLTEQELRDAAAEAGISPEELRQALVQRSGGTPGGALARSSGAAVQGYTAQTHLSLPPDQASERVRAAIGAQVGHRGHRQGNGDIDILDDKTGMVYRIHTEGDGQGGALVHVSTERTGGTLALAGTMFGAATLGIIGVGWLFSLSLFFWLGIGLLAAGGAGLFMASKRVGDNHRQAQLVVSQALVDAEEALPAADAPPRALRPG
ncbi:MAG: hypothetical protein JNL82_26730 [Myxococcales bacterium]|jgi:hypothetical protein|nr:hypothetical protein [Myxococcales bacterium]